MTCMFPPSGPGRYTRPAWNSIGSSCTISALARTQSKLLCGWPQTERVDTVIKSPSSNRFLIVESISARQGAEQRKIFVFSYISTRTEIRNCHGEEAGKQ